MGIFDIFRRSLPPELARKESAAYALHMTPGGTAQWHMVNKEAYAREGYQQNVVVFQAVNKIADAIASIPRHVMRGEQEVENHPLAALIERPNPVQSGAEFWRGVVSFLMIHGDAYIEQVTGTGGRAIELWPLRPDRITILPSPTGLPRGYEYRAGGRKLVFDADPATGESDVRHLKFFNPLDDWYGMSPLQAGAFSVDQHNEAMRWMQALLQNSARPSGALIVGSEDGLSDDQFARLKSDIESQYSGSGNAGKPMLLEGGMDWKQMGLSPSDMGIIEAKNSAARDVSLAMGVPPLLLNIPGDSTYSNYKEARLAFYEDTVLPLADLIVKEINNWLEPSFGATIMLDYDAVEAIADKRKEMWAMADKSLDLTLDEVREIKGYPPIGGELGRVLMADIRRGLQADATPPEQEEVKRAEAILYEMAYG